MRNTTSKFLDNIELWLSAAGVLVVWVAMLLTNGSEIMWQVATAAALAVGVLHGVIFWIVRRKQRIERRKAIREIREMLSDVVKNQLAVIGMYLPSERENPELKMQMEGINETIEKIASLVDQLSEESLQSWKKQYAVAVENCTDLDPVESNNETVGSGAMRQPAQAA